MPYKLHVNVCHNFKLEALAVIEALNFEKKDDISLLTFTAQCGHSPLNIKKLASSALKCSAPIIMLGGTCLKCLETNLQHLNNIHMKKLEQCYYMLANKELIDYYIAEGSYLITPGWLKNWRHYIEKAYAFNQQTAQKSWGETYKQLLLLDTGVDKNSLPLLEELSAFLNIPYKILPIGLDFFKFYLKEAITEDCHTLMLADYDKAIIEAQQKVTHYAVAFDTISTLAQITLEEEEIIKKALELYNILFTSNKIIYASYNNGNFYKFTSQQSNILVEDKVQWYNANLFKPFTINAAGNGFMMPIVFADEILGIIEVDALLYPEQISYYINLSTSLANVLALSLYNVRTYLALERTKNHLRLSESKNKAIINTIPDMLILVDIKGKIIDCKPQHRYFSYISQLKLNSTIYDIFPKDIAEQTMFFINKAVETGELQLFMYEQPINQQCYAYESRIAATNNNEILLIIRDMTDLVKMQKDFTRLENLNLIGEMASSIGHEVRNPMTTVRGFLQFIAGRPDFLKYKDRFDLMISELDRANLIITDFLSLAKNKAIEPKLENLNSIVEAMLPLLNANAIISGYNITFDLADIPEISVDEKEIRQLILNLCRNGLEAMPPGGKLIIRTYRDNNDIVLSIKDHGPGIPQEIIEQIGVPFFTTKENGTGLGLAVCYSIAARHNAKIDIATNAGGTTVAIKFPEFSYNQRAQSHPI